MVLMGCMNKSHFASYKFKPSDVIEGLNRYFAEAKANRYRRVPLEIKNGTVKPGNYYVFRDIVFYVAVPKVTECGYYYLVCDPEEVVGVAINWLREEHDIFYTPPKADELEAKIEPLSSTFYCCDSKLVTETQRLQEENKKLKKKVAEQQKKIDSYEATLSKITDIMEPKYAGPAWSETWDDLVERIKRMKGNLDYFADLAQKRQTELSNLRYDILKVYREIFDCSNGDPEGTDAEALQDILTEYKRTLELKNAAEEKTIKYKELARENEEKANKYKDIAKENRVQWNNTNAQLQWAQEENRKWLEKYEKLKSEFNEMINLYCGAAVGNGGLCEDLAKEREKVKRMEKKLIEIQDICER